MQNPILPAPVKKKRTKSQTAKLARRRGHQFERDCAIALRRIFPDAKRHLEYQFQEAAHGIDIDGTGRLKVQCKRGRGYSSINKIFEIKSFTRRDIPVLLTKGDDLEVMAVLPFKKLLALIRLIKMKK